MKIYKEIIRNYKEKVLDTKRCDLCDKTTQKEDWGESYFTVAETEIRLKTGSSYPDGGSGKEITFDICPKCFDKKLIPWFESQGAQKTEKEWDW